MVNFDEKKGRLYRVGEASTILGVHPNTIRRWEKQGKIKTIRVGAGHRRVSESEISQILYQTTTIPPSPQVLPAKEDDLSSFLDFVLSYHKDDPELVKRAEVLREKYCQSGLKTYTPTIPRAEIPERADIYPQKPERVAIVTPNQEKLAQEVLSPVKVGVPRHAILDALQPTGLAQRTAFGDLLSAATILKKFTAQELATRGKCPEQTAKIFCEKMAALGYATSSDGNFELKAEVTT